MERTNRALAAAVKTRDALIEAASDAIIACAADGTTVTTWNPAAERMFGFAASRVIGGPLPLVTDQRLEREHDSALRRVRDGEKVEVVTQWSRADGSNIDVHISLSSVADGAGRFAGWIGVAKDVSAEVAERRTWQERAEMVEHLASVTADLTAELDLESVLSLMLRGAADLAGAAAAAFLSLGPRPTFAAVHNLPAGLIGFQPPTDRGLFHEAVDARARRQVPDLHAFSNRVEEITRAAPGLHTVIATPVFVQGELAGVIALFYREVDRRLSANESGVLDLFAGNAGAAVTTAAAYQAALQGRDPDPAVAPALRGLRGAAGFTVRPSPAVPS